MGNWFKCSKLLDSLVNNVSLLVILELWLSLHRPPGKIQNSGKKHLSGFVEKAPTTAVLVSLPQRRLEICGPRFSCAGRGNIPSRYVGSSLSLLLDTQGHLLLPLFSKRCFSPSLSPPSPQGPFPRRLKTQELVGERKLREIESRKDRVSERREKGGCVDYRAWAEGVRSSVKQFIFFF